MPDFDTNKLAVAYMQDVKKMSLFGSLGKAAEIKRNKRFLDFISVLTKPRDSHYCMNKYVGRFEMDNFILFFLSYRVF